MADRRRRRKEPGSNQTECSESEEKESLKGKDTTTRVSGCESEGEESYDSEDYESATEDQDDDDDDEEESETEDEEGVVVENEGLDEEWIDEERQSGDGEEQPDKQAVDDDEDQKNPAYIPRKGAFYEHDPRMSEDFNEKEFEEQEDNRKKKLWKEEFKWHHDKFSDVQQGPKSREEIVAIYGYDIRSGDKPPDAPPARRGKPRGPRSQENRNFGDFVQDQRFRKERYSEDRQYARDNEQTNRNFQRGGRNNRSSEEFRSRDNDQNQRRGFRNRDEERHDRYNEDNFDQRRGRGGSSRGRGGRGQGRGGRGRGGFGNRQDFYDERLQEPVRPRSQPPGGRGGYQSNRGQNYDNRAKSEELQQQTDRFSDQRNHAPERHNVNKNNMTEKRVESDKKSYAKDRRNKNVEKPREEQTETTQVIEGQTRPNPAEDNQSPTSVQPDSQGKKTPADIQKQDVQQPRPKRYSSQRQRNVPETTYPEGGPTPPLAQGMQPPSSQYYNVPQGYPRQATPPGQPMMRQATPPGQPMMRQAMPYPVHSGVSATQISSPPRAYNVSAPGVPSTMMPHGFIPPPNLMNFATPVPHYQLATGMPVTPQFATATQGQVLPLVVPSVVPPTAQVPPMPQQAPSGPEGLAFGGTVYFQTESGTIPPGAPGPGQQHGGTTYYAPEQQTSSSPIRPAKPSGITYYSPETQQPKQSRSPVRRPKTAIPIVQPEARIGTEDDNVSEKNESDFVTMSETIDTEGDKYDTKQDNAASIPDETEQDNVPTKNTVGEAVIQEKTPIVSEMEVQEEITPIVSEMEIQEEITPTVVEQTEVKTEIIDNSGDSNGAVQIKTEDSNNETQAPDINNVVGAGDSDINKLIVKVETKDSEVTEDTKDSDERTTPNSGASV